MRSAKIVCTIGPASDSVETLTGLAEAGMAVARMNASHGTPEHRRTVIERVREVDENTAAPVAVMHDLPGPEVRTAPLEEPIQLEGGSTVRFVVGSEATPEEVGLSHDITAVEPGDRILLDDARIAATVESVDGGTITATVGNGGKLGGRKGVIVPGVELGLPTVTEKDRTELEVAAEKGVDFVAASFVRDGDFVREIEATLNDLGADIPIIAKIERDIAVDNIDSIIDAAYGVMVARGDLGVELPLEDVPMIQKRIIRKCNEAGVPVITATEMLDSMTTARRPTRAEASDVANAVLDGTDAVMLSGETAMGNHPVRVVETMANIVQDVESAPEYRETVEQRVPVADESRADALARSARFLARDIGADAIVAASESGYTALKAAKFRPSIPVVASTPNDTVRRRLTLSWGITPATAPYTTEGAGAVINSAVQSALETPAAESGDTVVVLSGMMTELEGVNTSNMLKIHVAAETIGRGQSVVPGLVSGPFHRVGDGSLDDVPEGAILSVPRHFDGEFTGDTDRIAGIVDAHEGTTGYAAMVARELSIPMVSAANVSDDATEGDVVTLDAERGVIYDDALHDRDER
ncbi:pyruvate kinase [Haloarcula onubensis]|uniref:Pyruvate kinase n=1 Tax=Haloarcula onubensis TaxID=2950539 RepID=A0ABU2FMP0_9EURY|nr:pyruvate kinase [Halomicroarcula sp. S3CR25-11]MDS0282024.1 pyruvate kinase [Halomicroarcula sp. S3CR25-11]